MRLLGAKIGEHAEMSTVWSFMPELLNAGESTFFADGCMLGGRRVFGGRFQIGVNRVGSRSFVGNGAILPTGASLGERCLLGVLSAPPYSAQATPDGTDWLGSPAFQLPNRQKVLGFGEEATYRPTRKLYAQRAVVDALRILIPSYTGFLLGMSGLAAVLYGYEVYGMSVTFALLPALGIVAASVAVGIVVALKWVVMGRFKPVIAPLWSPYVWFNEMVNGAYEFNHVAGRRDVVRHAVRGAAAAPARLQDRSPLLYRHGPVLRVRPGSDRRLCRAQFGRGHPEPSVRGPHHEIVLSDDRRRLLVGNMTVMLYDHAWARGDARAVVAIDEGRDNAGRQSLARYSNSAGLGWGRGAGEAEAKRCFE